MSEVFTKGEQLVLAYLYEHSIATPAALSVYFSALPALPEAERGLTTRLGCSGVLEYLYLRGVVDEDRAGVWQLLPHARALVATSGRVTAGVEGVLRG